MNHLLFLLSAVILFGFGFGKRTNLVNDSKVNATEYVGSQQSDPDQAHILRRQNENIVKQTLRASSSENCEILKNPFAVLKGEVCGSHYKVLNLNRKKSPVDKSTVRKAYHKLSLATHPDKNPGIESDSAFTFVQSAYDCLSDSTCQQEYNEKLDNIEYSIRANRIALRTKINREINKIVGIVSQAAVVIATRIDEIGSQLSQLCTYTVSIFDQDVDVGKLAASFLLLWKAKLLFYLFGISKAIVHLNSNEELQRQWNNFPKYFS